MRLRTTNTRKRSGGFTLMEALVVVAIIALSAAIAAPSVIEAMADREANEAAQDLVRIGVHGQTAAMAYGRAHVLRYAAASGGGQNGSVQLWRGRSSLCSANPWTTIISGACADNENCVEQVDMDTHGMGSYAARLRLPGTTTADLCFQPDGELMVSADGGVFAPTPPAGADGVTFTITRFLSGTQTGVARSVVFPLGGTPRVVR
jgi:prepilin-type N-terminal cleavage/methylation domain-containing protein